jgi:hypothetical protein
MESTNRNAWIVVAVLGAILLLACCCALIVGGAALAGFSVFSTKSDVSSGAFSDELEQAISVGDSPSLEINNFAGNVSIRAGESGTIHVVATKRASRSRDLSVIGVGIHEKQGGVVIKTGRPLSKGKAAVDLQITAPPDSRLELDLGAGNASVQGLGSGAEVTVGAGNISLDEVTGPIQANTGAGTMNVRGAAGPARLSTGTGVMMYQGAPQGDCHFNTGLGAISLELPAQTNVTVDMKTEVGEIDVKCPVDGQVSKRRVQGIIGTGDDARIVANAGASGISLTCK